MNSRQILGLTGFLVSAIGILTCFCWNAVLDSIIAKEFPLRPNSKTFEVWKDPDLPVQLNVYFFNWTNPENIFDADFKPNLVEIGPYSFKEYFKKVNVTWHNNNNTISYLRKRFWYYDEENSIGPLSDNITTLNPTAVSAAYVLRNSNYLMKVSLSSAIRISQQKIWITKTVGEFFFYGYSDTLITLASKMSSLGFVPTALDKFAWYYLRNGSETYEGTFNMDTGADDIHKIARVREWKYSNRTTAFDAECGMINGTDGMFFGPGLTRDKPLQMFSTEFCRTINFDYLEDTEVKGIPSYRFIGSKTMLDSGTLDPNNWCLCKGECLPQGVINISSCQFGAPGFVSYPHFLYADPYYLKSVEGLKPNEAKHRFEVTVEPITGLPMSVSARLQVNLLLQSYSGISLYENVPKILFPMLWCEEIVTVEDKDADQLKLLLAVPIVGFYFSVGLMLLGLIMMTSAYILWKQNKNPSGKRIENQKKESILKMLMPFMTSRVKQPPEMPEEHDLLNINQQECTIK